VRGKPVTHFFFFQHDLWPLNFFLMLRLIQFGWLFLHPTSFRLCFLSTGQPPSVFRFRLFFLFDWSCRFYRSLSFPPVIWATGSTRDEGRSRMSLFSCHLFFELVLSCLPLTKVFIVFLPVWQPYSFPLYLPQFFQTGDPPQSLPHFFSGTSTAVS